MSKKYLNSEKHHKEHSKWDRRGFMKVLGLAGAGSISLGSTNLSVLNSNFITNALSNSISDRVLVLVRDTPPHFRSFIKHRKNSYLYNISYRKSNFNC